MIKFNNKNREYFGFIITYIIYLTILLSIIYYSFFMLKNSDWGFIGTITLIFTGIFYPILYYKTIKKDDEELEESTI